MSKAILILDMPKTCEDCQLRNFNQCYGLPLDRTIIEEWDGEDVFKKRNHICPLKPLPQKLDANDWHRMFSGKYEIREAKGEGYNFCLNEILGGEE